MQQYRVCQFDADRIEVVLTDDRVRCDVAKTVTSSLGRCGPGRPAHAPVVQARVHRFTSTVRFSPVAYTPPSILTPSLS